MLLCSVSLHGTSMQYDLFVQDFKASFLLYGKNISSVRKVDDDDVCFKMLLPLDV